MDSNESSGKIYRNLFDSIFTFTDKNGQKERVLPDNVLDKIEMFSSFVSDESTTESEIKILESTIRKSVMDAFIEGVQVVIKSDV